MKKMFVLSILLNSISTAMAATTTYETRAINHEINSDDYKASWDAQTSGITAQTLTDFNGAIIPNALEGFSHLIIGFNAQNAGAEWGFRLAPDAGLGGAIYLDGKLLSKDTSDLWWGYDWNNSSEILSKMNLSVTAGDHFFEGYWAEDCCNGGQGVQFTTNGGQDWQSMSILPSPSSVPVPGALWLFGSALAGIASVCRPKTAAV